MEKKRKDSRGRVLRKGEAFREKEGRYSYEYKDTFGNRKTIYSVDLLKLREREKQIERDISDGLNIYVAGKATLNYLFERYMDTKYNLRENTKVNYKYMYDNYVRNTIGKRLIADIKYSDIVYFYKSLITEKGLELNTVDTIHTVIHPVFSMAVRDDVIRKNPASGVLADIKKESGKNKGIRHALTIEQQRVFMKYMIEEEQFNHWIPIFTILLGTGCRVGEFIGLRWEDVDFKQKVISINHSIAYVCYGKEDGRKSHYAISLPKTEAGIRYIPMTDEVYDVFKAEYYRQQENGFSQFSIEGMSGFIFTNRCGRIYNQQTLNKGLKRISENYNQKELIDAKKQKREPIILPHFTCHQLRHTFATRLCESTSNLKAIQDIMGHANIETTMDIYAEATVGAKQKAIENLSNNLKLF